MVVLESYLLDILGQLFGNGSKDSGGDDSVRLPYSGRARTARPSAVASLDFEPQVWEYIYSGKSTRKVVCSIFTSVLCLGVVCECCLLFSQLLV